MNTSLPPLPSTLDVSDQFPSLARWNFFNHSGVSPLPRRAADAIRLFATQCEQDAYMTGKWYSQAETTRRLAAELINADSKEIAFIKNTSEGLSFVARGLDWQPGDEIISARTEYPANAYPWIAAAKYHGVKYVTVDPRPDGRIHLDDLFAAVTPRTRLIAISHVQFGTGFRIDLAAIGEFCRAHKAPRPTCGTDKILFCVDAIQSMGVLPVDVKGMQIDYLSAGGHKWMLGPEGLGIFYCRREMLDSLEPEVGSMNVVNATDFSNINFTLRNDAKRFECGGYNHPGILGLGASLVLLQEIGGIPVIWPRVQALMNMLAGGLQQKGYIIHSPRDREDETSGILSFYSPTRSHKENAGILAALEKQKIILVERENRLRAAPHFYQGEEQINALISAIPPA